MSNLKEETIDDITIEEVVKELEKNRNKILEEFSKAYLAETGLLPSQVELVHKKLPLTDGIIEETYQFRRKK